jgi:hypothetical protein
VDRTLVCKWHWSWASSRWARLAKLEDDLIHTQVKSLAIWTPLNLINFYYIPAEWRVVYIRLKASIDAFDRFSPHLALGLWAGLRFFRSSVCANVDILKVSI